jgi:acyl carrier protein
MSIEATIEKYIVEEIMLADRNTKIDPDESLIDSGILDSLALLRFINFLEDQFDIMVDDIEVVPDNFQSINTAASFVSTKLANGS